MNDFSISLKLIKTLLDVLNKKYPPPKNGVLSVKRNQLNKLVEVKVPVDPYFVAYCTKQNTWFLLVSNYWVWQECYDEVEQLLIDIKKQYQFKIIFCHVHPVAVKHYQRCSINKEEGIKMFFGQISW